jgi:hypothetical protein
VVEHQSHLEHLLSFEEARRQQTDDHVKQMGELTALISEVKSQSITHTQRVSAQLDGLCSTMEAHTTTTKADLVDIRGRIVPNLRYLTPAKFASWVTSDKGLISHLSFQAHKILSWGLKRSFGDKLAITLSRNFISVCNFMTVNDFYIRYGTLPHTLSHFCHTLGKLHTLWEV